LVNCDSGGGSRRFCGANNHSFHSDDGRDARRDSAEIPPPRRFAVISSAGRATATAAAFQSGFFYAPPGEGGSGKGGREHTEGGAMGRLRDRIARDCLGDTQKVVGSAAPSTWTSTTKDRGRGENPSPLLNPRRQVGFKGCSSLWVTRGWSRPIPAECTVSIVISFIRTMIAVPTDIPPPRKSPKQRLGGGGGLPDLQQRSPLPVRRQDEPGEDGRPVGWGMPEGDGCAGASGRVRRQRTVCGPHGRRQSSAKSKGRMAVFF